MRECRWRKGTGLLDSFVFFSDFRSILEHIQKWHLSFGFVFFCSHVRFFDFSRCVCPVFFLSEA